MRSSSVRSTPSFPKMSGWFGTILSSTTTDRVALAISISSRVGVGGLFPRLAPPEMKSSAVEWARLSGLTTSSQCFHSVRFTSFVVSQCCDVRSSAYPVALSSRREMASFQA